MTDDKQPRFVPSMSGFWVLKLVPSDGEFKVYREPIVGWELRTKTPSLRSSAPTAWFASPTGRASPSRRSGAQGQRASATANRDRKRHRPVDVT